MKAPAHSGNFRVRQQARGMALVETVVVFAIVAALAGLTAMAWRGATDRARLSRCLANLRAIGGAVHGYVTEHDGNLPRLAGARSSRSEDVPVMDTVLLPYVEDPEIFRCPADRQGIYEATGSSYFWNYLPTIMEDGSRNERMVSMQFELLQTSSPSKIPLVVTKEAFHFGGSRGTVLYADGRSELAE